MWVMCLLVYGVSLACTLPVACLRVRIIDMSTGGIFLGRVLLAEPTHRFGDRRMTMGYCVAILGLQLVFWLVPNMVSSAVAISFLGFFFGPMFATGMSIATKIFPKHIQPTALGKSYGHHPPSNGSRWNELTYSCQGLCSCLLRRVVRSSPLLRV